MNIRARAHLIVSGRVQGVFFRAFTRDTGTRLGLAGWVRNLPDGSVEAVFEGGREAVKKAVEACRTGPPSSRVTDVKVAWEEPTGESGAFTVRYH